MRTFYLSVFWGSNVGSVVQLMVIATAGTLVVTGSHTFQDLTVLVFVTVIAPWLEWIRTLFITLFGDFGRWLLTLPILIVSPLRLVVGILIGLWAYNAANSIPAGPVRPGTV